MEKKKKQQNQPAHAVPIDNPHRSWTAVRDASAILMMEDADFEERVRRPGPAPRIIWLTCGNTSEKHQRQMLTDHLGDALELIRQGESLVEIH